MTYHNFQMINTLCIYIYSLYINSWISIFNLLSDCRISVFNLLSSLPDLRLQSRRGPLGSWHSSNLELVGVSIFYLRLGLAGTSLSIFFRLARNSSVLDLPGTLQSWTCQELHLQSWTCQELHLQCST